MASQERAESCPRIRCRLVVERFLENSTSKAALLLLSSRRTYIMIELIDSNQAQESCGDFLTYETVSAGDAGLAVHRTKPESDSS